MSHNRIKNMILSRNSMVEKNLIEETLKHCDNNRTLTAEALNISRKTLFNKMKRYRLNLFTCLVIGIASLCVSTLCDGRTPSSLRKIKDFVIYEDVNYYSSFPSIVRRPDGEYLLAFRRAPDRRLMGEKDNIHCDQNSYLVMLRSPDGETWTHDPELICAYPFGGSQDPCLLQLRNGDLLCTSYAWTLKPRASRNQNDSPYSDYAFLGGYYLRSVNGGQYWQGPFYPPT
ncbi:MAG: hypothetical protein LBC68_13520, partial [Prevotellaceae bacterium]|nr:hypothetical protein [Prevotellaceae bacterium]